jgi:beta-fructofuranosidase
MLAADYKELLKKANQNIDEVKETVDQTYWRLQYHVTPTAYWMNDPNGFSYFKGEYHLFYQHHPFSPKWGPMHWGHVKSKDLVHWERLTIALAPSESYDRDGCFSGSAIEKDGKLYLIYTGNIGTGVEPDVELKQVQALALSDDGIHFEKVERNPVIPSLPKGDFDPAHFRDPKVWKHGEIYYCVIGSKTLENKGQVLLYKSMDLISWDFINVMARADGNMGFMWECPDLFELSGKDILMMSPQGLTPEGILYHNLHQSGYLVGDLDYEEGILSHGPFQLLDYGFDFYAPQSLVDHLGRRIMIGWMDMWESEMPTQAFNWAGAMTLPRLLELKGDHIYSKPVPELKALRENERSYHDILVQDCLELEGISGDCLELEVSIDPKEATHFGIQFRCSQDKQEKTVLMYDREKQLITLDRTHSGKGEKGIRQADVQLVNDELKLHLFIDGSSVEVFINDGEKVMTARIFPSKESKGIQFFSDKPFAITQLKKWELKNTWRTN